MPKFICIRRCFDKDCRSWYVGDIYEGDQPPTKHFDEVKKKVNPIDHMRKKIEGLGLSYDKEWPLDRLQREYEQAVIYLNREAAKKEEKEEKPNKKDKKAQKDLFK